MQGQKRFSPKLFYNVSLDNLVPADHILRRFESLLSLEFLSFVEAREVPKEFIKRVYQENDFKPDEPVVKDGRIGRHHDGQADVTKMGRRRKRCFVNSKLETTTDPEVSIVFRMGRGRQSAYKGHLAVDGDSRVITSVEVSSGVADDTTAVASLVQGHVCQVGQQPHRIVADSHYGTSEVYNYLAHQGINAVIRPRRTKNRPGFLTADDLLTDYDRSVWFRVLGSRMLEEALSKTP
jgi:hypothetical protein